MQHAATVAILLKNSKNTCKWNLIPPTNGARHRPTPPLHTHKHTYTYRSLITPIINHASFSLEVNYIHIDTKQSSYVFKSPFSGQDYNRYSALSTRISFVTLSDWSVKATCLVQTKQQWFQILNDGTMINQPTQIFEFCVAVVVMAPVI